MAVPPNTSPHPPPVAPTGFRVGESRWRRGPAFGLYALAIGLLAGCATHPRQSMQATPPQRSQHAIHSFSVGMTRGQVREDLTDSWLLVSASRPAGGWSSQISPPAGGQAATFERFHSDAVEACDVYWVGHTHAPAMYYGIRLNYFYYDRNQRLIGFERWVID